MKLVTLILILTIVSPLLTGCGTLQRTKHTDKRMSLFIDPSNGINSEQYVDLEASFMATEKWYVKERSRGFQAIKKEQQMIHRDDVDMFNDKSKYAWYGEFHSVGAIAIGKVGRCTYTRGFLGVFGEKRSCPMYLKIVDSSTSELIASVKHRQSTDIGTEPSWDETVEKLVAAYPEDFKTTPKHEKLRKDEVISEERAVRQKEKLAKEQTTIGAVDELALKSEKK